MSLRLSYKLYDALTEASKRTGFSITDIGNKSMRKYERYVAELNVVEIYNHVNDYELMRLPTNIRFKPELVKGKTSQEKRNILWWYINLSRDAEQIVPLKIDPEEQKAIQADIIEGNRNIQKLHTELYANGAFVDYGEVDVVMGG